MRRFAVTLIMVFWCCVSFAQHDTLQVSVSGTTHMMFAEELVYVDISSKLIAAKIVDGNKKVLAIKAKEEFTGTTTVSALESNGSLHTYIVAYDPHPEAFIYRFDTLSLDETYEVPASVESLVKPSDWSGFKRRLFHIADREYGIAVQCCDIYTANDMTTVVLSLENQSVLSYQTTSPRFVIEGRKTSRKKPHIEKAVYPVSCTDSRISVSSGARMLIAYSFEKLTITKEQVLKVYFYETGGTRNFVLTINARDINGK